MNVLVYARDGRYSFNVGSGGEPVDLALAEGYATLTLLDGTKIIVGKRIAVTIEEAIFHGFAQIIDSRAIEPARTPPRPAAG